MNKLPGKKRPTGAVKKLLSLTPLFYKLAIAQVGMDICFKSLKKSGLIKRSKR